MGSLLSRPSQNKSHIQKAETERIISELAALTDFSRADLEEMYLVFMYDYPAGVITKADFIRDNANGHGGPEDLWSRVFDFIVHDEPVVYKQSASPGFEESIMEKSAIDADDDIDAAVRVNALHQRRTSAALASRRQSAVSETDDDRVPGTIGFRDMMLYLHERQTTPAEKKLKSIFRFLDLNGDGFIGEREVHIVFTWIYALTESQLLRDHPDVATRLDEGQELVDPAARAKAFILAMDVDGDGGLNEPEFVEGCRGDQGTLELLSAIVPR